MTHRFLPTRRWLRFSLRTMFIAVTLVAAFVAYHVNWIRQRHAVMEGRFADEVYVQPWDFSQEILDELFDDLTWTPKPAQKFKPPPGPGLLWLFSERGYPKLDVNFGPPLWHERELTSAELLKVEQIQRLFPESKISAAAMRSP
ncbi:MAG TPA: hypothetical protein VGJ26_15915 [Pirellulales bacterium]|jgi:hypothetical protein